METRRTGRVPWGIAVLIAAIICALSVLGAYLTRQITAEDVYGEYTTVSLTGNEGVQVSGNGFVYYNGSTLASVSSSGETLWTYMVGANASFNASDAGVAAWSGQTLTVIDREQASTIYSNPSMEAEVLSARTGEVYTAVLLAPEHDSTIVLIENGGREVDRITFADQTVLDYGFFSSGELFWVMSLDTSGTVPTTSISTYRPGRMIVGSITDSQQLMYQVMFQSSQVVCAGTTYLKVFDYTGQEVTDKRVLTYGWYLAAVEQGRDDPMMAFVPDAQYGAGGEMRDVRMIRSNLDQIVRMPYPCKGPCRQGGSRLRIFRQRIRHGSPRRHAGSGRLYAGSGVRRRLRRNRRPRSRHRLGQYRLSRYPSLTCLFAGIIREKAGQDAFGRLAQNRPGMKFGGTLREHH